MTHNYFISLVFILGNIKINNDAIISEKLTAIKIFFLNHEPALDPMPK